MARVVDRHQFLRDFQREANDCIRAVTANGETTSVIRNVLSRLEGLHRDLRYAKRGELIGGDEFESISTSLSRLCGLLSQQAQQLSVELDDGLHYQSVRVADQHRRGASKYNISLAQLEFLMACRFTLKTIAEILQVSVKTVTRRLREFNLRQEVYSDITDDRLDETVTSLMFNNRKLGANALVTRLQNKGIRVQRERVRQAMRRVDPAGVALRSRRVLRRRVYRVEGPNSMWHLDGNHKLIRWRIVVHAAVDGYSRLITFMDARTNNRAASVFSSFRKATEQYGVPARIRCDNGGENSEVCRFMEEHHGFGRGSAIRGRSVHNQRVERNWLEMWNGCLNVFYDLFTAFERDGVLNPNSEQQIFALHFVYLPRIQYTLEQFVKQWNHHKMRTEHSKSPLQLFIQRSLELQGSASRAIRDIFSPVPDSDMPDDRELDSPPNSDHSEEEMNENRTVVNVPSTRSPINEEREEQLRQHINPLAGIDSGSLGLDLYMETLDFIDESEM